MRLFKIVGAALAHNQASLRARSQWGPILAEVGGNHWIITASAWDPASGGAVQCAHQCRLSNSCGSGFRSATAIWMGRQTAPFPGTVDRFSRNRFLPVPYAGQPVVADRRHRSDRGGHLLVLLRGNDAHSATEREHRRAFDRGAACAFAYARRCREASSRKFGNLCSRLDRHFWRGFSGSAYRSRFRASAAGGRWHGFLRRVDLSDPGCAALRIVECGNALHLASPQRRRLGVGAPVDRAPFSLVVEARGSLSS